MDLIYISPDMDPTNAKLSLTTGQPVYELHTNDMIYHSEPTTIRKFQQPGYPPANIGEVRVRSIQSDVCQLLGKDIRPRTENPLSSGRSFTSSADGQKYTWKGKAEKATLADSSKNTVATYEENDYMGELAMNVLGKISITPAGMPILDEIVVTCIYFQAKIRAKAEAKAAGDIVDIITS
ncbi:hypothetical protein PM082_012645 [Marasmius tenuissimus]|nr:hypothetical protein PM082_012645 [Marasmius tenuissimus]